MGTFQFAIYILLAFVINIMYIIRKRLDMQH